MTDDQRGDVYRLVFELTARATDVPYETFLDELVEGLARHYAATVCRVHVGETLHPAATGDPKGALAGMSSDTRAHFDAIDSMLAEEVRRDGVLRMALDLDGGDDIVNFLARTMRTPDSFAFPLMARGRAFGAITLYLEEPYPFEEADVRGLQAVGNVLYAANNQGADFQKKREIVPVTNEHLQAYQDTLDRIRRVLDELLFLTDARSVMLIDNRGDFVAKSGEESKFATTSFSTVVASGFAAGSRLAGLYGGQEIPYVVHEGDDESVFVMEVAGQALLCVVYDDHEAPHLITRWAQSAAGRLETLVAELTEVRVL